MSTFSIEGFARTCKEAMASAEDRHQAASSHLKEALAEHSPEEMIEVLEAAIPPGASIGEMIVHLSPELTMLYARVPARFQSGIHDHTVFACIGQLRGEEKNVFYMRDPEAGLRVSGELLTTPGHVLDLGPSAIHSIENPADVAMSALHIYGGDFQALMDQRTLWSSAGYKEQPFTFEGLMRESVAAMKRDGNAAGLQNLASAVPALRGLIEAL